MRHHHDAGGTEEVLERKAELRDRVWSRLEQEDADRFPGARGRIPNYTGAERAAERLSRTTPWRRASTVKANPDSPQWPVRQRALEDARRVYMAVPKLADERPFFLLDPADLETSPREASSIKGASRVARQVGVEEMEPVDLVVTGCVAASPDGARLGKGGGFSDLEYALAREAGLVEPDTPVVTTVHELQVVTPDAIPMTGHDIPLDLIVTPERVIAPASRPGRPGGVDWSLLTEEKIDAIPLLRRLRPDLTGPGS
jgi:5-formyltetrahydrofolate cyclo-ligase